MSFLLKKNSIADLVASDMADIMDSDEYRAVFSKPKAPVQKIASNQSSEQPVKLSKADLLNHSVKSLCRISDILDNLGLERSAFMTLQTLDRIIIEAKDMDEKEDDEDEKDKDKKKDKKDKEEDDENDAQDPLADIREQMERERTNLGPGGTVQRGKTQETIPAPPGSGYERIPADRNNAQDPLADIHERMERERTNLGPGGTIQHGKTQETIPAPPGSGYERIPADRNKGDDGVRVFEDEEGKRKALEYGGSGSHGTTAPVKEAPKAEPEPKHKREYKHPWERDSFDIDMDDDGVSRMTPEQRQKALEQAPVQHHGTTAPVKEAPKAEPEPKHKREYKQPWERDSFEINMSNDSAIDVGLGNISGYGDTGNASDRNFDDDEKSGEQLRSLLEEMGVTASRGKRIEDKLDLKTIAGLQNYLTKIAKKKYNK